ncbi:hypothetical protein IM511_09365 [Erythrobacteraceae bacterium E2-1 Yellow Sea]|nr:hypothetical protein [Erythrobacteraceae bacterium E2-1 Yellow Sea]
MVFVPVCAQANTRASAAKVNYQTATRQASIAPQLASKDDDDDDLDGIVWIIGGTALAAIIIIAISGGSGSSTRTPNQSNGAN